MLCKVKKESGSRALCPHAGGASNIAIHFFKLNSWTFFAVLRRNSVGVTCPLLVFLGASALERVWVISIARL